MFLRTQLFYLSFLVVFCAATACKRSDKPPETANPKPILDPVPPASAAKAPGDYCFWYKAENLSIDGRLTLSEGARVEGNLKGKIIDGTTGSGTEYDTSFNGSLRGDSLYLEVLSTDSGTKEATRETWAWTKDGLLEGDHLLATVNCPN